jgi:hypothetical protein
MHSDNYQGQGDDGSSNDCDVNRICQESVVIFMKGMFEQGSELRAAVVERARRLADKLASSKDRWLQ